MKRILGLDLGTASIGWAVVNEGDVTKFDSEILAAGVRRYPLTVDETKSFSKGEPILTNVDRRLKHGVRLNNFRFKLRREDLRRLLIGHGILSPDTILAENGADSTYSLLELRAKAATERIGFEDFGRVLMMLNKKRGYRSSRKSNDVQDGDSAIDTMDIALELQNRNITSGQYALEKMQEGASRVPQFFRSDLENEFYRIVDCQVKFYPQLTPEFVESLKGKNDSQTWKMLSSVLDIKGAKRVSGRGREQKIEELTWRVQALKERVDAEVLAHILAKINGSIASASGLLSAMSDRSKELIVNNETIGQYKYRKLKENPHFSFKNISFYRKDYQDEFDTIWDTQAKFHKELTPELKREVRDRCIFYQRPLKSQKDKVATCELESHLEEVKVDGNTKKMMIGPKVAPKSSPLFQQFRIYQTVNNLKINDEPLSEDQRVLLYQNLEFCNKLIDKEILALLGLKAKDAKLNYKEVPGNRTATAILSACEDLLAIKGYDVEFLEGLNPAERAKKVANKLEEYGFKATYLYFNIEDKNIENQPAYRLWHTLYSAESDDSRSGNETLKRTLSKLLDIPEEETIPFVAITFEPDYGSLSVKAIKKIIPFMADGLVYSDACEIAGYNHSKRSETREQKENRVYDTHIDILPKNSLRSPVVEKILNQMIRVVNELMEVYGQFDEIRIEMARELKKSAKDRKQMTDSINNRAKDNERIINILKTAPFNIAHPSSNDIVRYRLYEELEFNGYKTLYSGTYIPKEELFGKGFNIEHIIPQSVAFDDSFSNKTIETTDVNLAKGNQTAIDYIEATFGESAKNDYLNKVDVLEKKGIISHTKAKNLKCKVEDIPSEFLNRDLSMTQYIARKAKEILENVTPTVTATIGSITDRLREDWGLIDVMKELNWDKYDRLGLTTQFTNRDGKVVERIVDWTKRNDNRHHALDAITIAFTRPVFIQYLNNLNAQSDKGSEIYGIKKKYIYRDEHGNLRFLPPMPAEQMRKRVRETLESILVSTKAKNKVVTANVDKIKTKHGDLTRKYLTPRMQLHNETIYGRSLRYETEMVSVGGGMTEDVIAKVASKAYREALLKRFLENGGDSKKAFTGKNSLAKNPIYLDAAHTQCVPDKVMVVELVPCYTQKVAITENLDIAKVLDSGIRRILEHRLVQFGGDKKKAFSNLEENPIYLNKEKGITIKKVKIKARVSDPIAIHDAHDHLGNLIYQTDGTTIPTDYVAPAGNHHVALFETPSGAVEEVMVSNFEAVARAISIPPMPIIDRNVGADEGWKFLMTLKRNEYVVFPEYHLDEKGKPDGMIFDPKDIDLLNPDNYALISPHLYRVQKLSSCYYVFRHHLETTVDESKDLLGITYKRITSIKLMRDVVKVRVDALGHIVHVGEY
ncbi:MAG: type II CRISPR RNA-guided endonuclease Cas9 [Muribaculaceae bacterium]|nr:type II CRISPR RNA-guided endonuclease Cas9 [Muribaculaceae bacterium]